MNNFWVTFFVCFCVFGVRFFLCSPGLPPWDVPASSPWVLGLLVWAIRPDSWLSSCLSHHLHLGCRYGFLPSLLFALLLDLRVDVNVCVVRILTYSSVSYAFSLNIYYYCMRGNTRVCTSQRIIGITLILPLSTDSRNFPQLTRVVLQGPLLSEVSERF